MSPTDFAELRQSLPNGVQLGIAPVQDCFANLAPQEQDLVRHAVASRRYEFSSARQLGHSLLKQLGAPCAPVLRHEDRSPAWPPGILGSLSHSRHWCAAIVARKRNGVVGLGVDVEDRSMVQENLFAEILTSDEIQRLHDFAHSESHSAWALSAFSIKEALFKAMWPLGNAGLGFQAMEVDFFSQPGSPSIRPRSELRSRLPQGCLPVTYQVRHQGALLSVVLLPAPDPSQ